jgi:hypothetical protein
MGVLRQTFVVALVLVTAACTGGPPAQDAGSKAAPAQSGAGGAVPGNAAGTCDSRAASDVAMRLGERLARVSLLAPQQLLADQIRTEYGPLVTASLLARWTASPREAPGREVSSPWPARIEVHAVTADVDGSCTVEADVVYLTSEEVAHGGAAARQPVTVQVVDRDGWRVDAYVAASAQAASGAQQADTTIVRPSPDVVVRNYYAAIAARDYRRAYAMWGDDGKSSGQTLEQFAAGFARTQTVAVDVGPPGRVEGAAGSRYVDVPVVVRATTQDGENQRFEGTYTLRRVVVDGASPAQRRWHLSSADLARR